MKNKYQEGEWIYEKANPSIDLIIRRYIDNIYYCNRKEEPEEKELVYFERQILPIKNRITTQDEGTKP